MSAIEPTATAEELSKVLTPMRNMLDQYQQEADRLTQALADEQLRHENDLAKIQSELDEATKLRDLHLQALDLLKPMEARKS